MSNSIQLLLAALAHLRIFSWPVIIVIIALSSALMAVSFTHIGWNDVICLYFPDYYWFCAPIAGLVRHSQRRMTVSVILDTLTLPIEPPIWELFESGGTPVFGIRACFSVCRGITTFSSGLLRALSMLRLKIRRTRYLQICGLGSTG